MSEHVYDIARAEREHLRWIILSALWHSNPYGCNEQILVRTAQDVPLRVTSDMVRRESDYLKNRGLIEINQENPLWHMKLTANGVDVVEYREASPSGIARPPKW